MSLRGTYEPKLKAAFRNLTEQSGLSREGPLLQKHIFLDATDETEELLENLNLPSVSHLACMERFDGHISSPVTIIN